MKAGPSPHAPRTIRRYDNRKLYDVQARRYVTLDGLGRLVGGGTDVQVVDQRTGEEITTVVLAQVVLEGIRQRTATIPHQVLSGHPPRLRRGGRLRGMALSRGGPTRARHESERISVRVVTLGRLPSTGAGLRQEIAGSPAPGREAQAGLQARIRGCWRAKGPGVTPPSGLKGGSDFEMLLNRRPPARQTAPGGRTKVKTAKQT